MARHRSARVALAAAVGVFGLTASGGTPVRHRLSEVEPDLFLAGNGETLDLRGHSPRWRGLALNPVTNGPLAWQWALLAGEAAVAVGWLLLGCVALVRRRRSSTPGPPPNGRSGRRLTTAVATVAALTALVTVAVIRVMPGLVDVGFLGRLPVPLPARLALHLRWWWSY